MKWRHLALAGSLLYSALAFSGDTSPDQASGITPGKIVYSYDQSTNNEMNFDHVDLCEDSRTVREIVSDYPYSLDAAVEGKLDMVDALNNFLEHHVFYEGKRSFCIFSPGEDGEKWALNIVKKGSQKLEISRISSEKKVLEDLKSSYDEKIYDFSLFKVYTPGAPLTLDFLKKDYGTIARFILHERFHEVNDPYKQSPVIIEEAMAEMLEHVIAKEFLNSDYGKPWQGIAKSVEEHLEKRLKTADNYIRAYAELEPIINNPTYSDETKDELAQPIFTQLKKEENLDRLNWANFASEFKYLRHLPLLKRVHYNLGNDSNVTIREFLKIEEEHRDDDYVDANEVLAEIKLRYAEIVNIQKARALKGLSLPPPPKILTDLSDHPVF